MKTITMIVTLIAAGIKWWLQSDNHEYASRALGKDDAVIGEVVWRGQWLMRVLLILFCIMMSVVPETSYAHADDAVTKADAAALKGELAKINANLKKITGAIGVQEPDSVIVGIMPHIAEAKEAMETVNNTVITIHGTVTTIEDFVEERTYVVWMTLGALFLSLAVAILSLLWMIFSDIIKAISFVRQSIKKHKGI